MIHGQQHYLLLLTAFVVEVRQSVLSQPARHPCYACGLPGMPPYMGASECEGTAIIIIDRAFPELNVSPFFSFEDATTRSTRRNKRRGSDARNCSLNMKTP